MADKWKVPCTTEGVDVFTWADSAPTACPHDSSHTINSGGVELATSLLFRFKEANTAQTTLLQAWQNALTLTPTLGLAEGIYIVSWTAEMRVTPVGPLNSRTQIRMEIDGNTKGNSGTVDQYWVCHSGWDRYAADEGDKPVITLDFRRDATVGGNDTAEVRKVRLGVTYYGLSSAE